MNDGYLQDDTDDVIEVAVKNSSLSAEEIYAILGCEELE